MNKESKLLSLCAECKSISVSDNFKIWLSRRNNPRLYDNFLKFFNIHPNSVFNNYPSSVRKIDMKKISHGTCPDCKKKLYPDLYN